MLPNPEPLLPAPPAGQAPPALLAETRAALGSVAEQAAAAGCGPPLILAYCHYPLSTIDSAPQRSPGPLGVLGHASRSALAMQGLTRVRGRARGCGRGRQHGGGMPQLFKGLLLKAPSPAAAQPRSGATFQDPI